MEDSGTLITLTPNIVAAHVGNARDGAAISDLDVVRITAIEDSEIVLVDAA